MYTQDPHILLITISLLKSFISSFFPFFYRIFITFSLPKSPFIYYILHYHFPIFISAAMNRNNSPPTCSLRYTTHSFFCSQLFSTLTTTIYLFLPTTALGLQRVIKNRLSFLCLNSKVYPFFLISKFESNLKMYIFLSASACITSTLFFLARFACSFAFYNTKSNCIISQRKKNWGKHKYNASILPCNNICVKSIYFTCSYARIVGNESAYIGNDTRITHGSNNIRILHYNITPW